MTDKQPGADEEFDAFNALFRKNMAKIEELSSEVLSVLRNRSQRDLGAQATSTEFFARATGAVIQNLLRQPQTFLQMQAAFWRDLERVSKPISTKSADEQGDRRFSNPHWVTHPYFQLIKAQYLASCQAIREGVAQIEGLTDHDQICLEFYAEQLIDSFSPSNFLTTNPDAMALALQTNGQSLVRGLENLLTDLRAHDGELLVRLVDETGFELGKNLGQTAGRVVYKNHLFELIQYVPQTTSCYEIPLVICPPWINKYYILDLQAQNSLVKWLVEQGFSVFIVSWVNPDERFREIGFEDYVKEGCLQAIHQVKSITGQDKVNAVGYCIGGTALSLGLSLLRQRGDQSVKSASFFATITEFRNLGQMSVFLEPRFIDQIEREVNETGYLDGVFMAQMFSYMRPRTLIYQPAVHRYLLGKAPPVLDLLFWNDDWTNLPARMAVDYLKKLCVENQFARGEFLMDGFTLSLSDIDVPVCAIACETDHIAPWRASFSGFTKMGSAEKLFILAQSGHIAGIVNPPSGGKYGHYINLDSVSGFYGYEDAAAWQSSAEFLSSSWWCSWRDWLVDYSGAQCDVGERGSDLEKRQVLAPGEYVLKRHRSGGSAPIG